MRKQEFRFQTHLPSPARRGSRSRPPLRRPRPLRFERLPVPVWNPYSRGRLGPAKSEDRKGGEGKTDANLTIFLAPAAPGTPTRRHALGRLPTPPPLPENLLSDCTENCRPPLRRPRPFAIQTAPSARLESLHPRPPQPCQVGRPKGRRGKNPPHTHN